MITRSPRTDTQLEITVLNDGTRDIYNFFTLNLSRTGMLIASKEIIQVDIDDPISVVIDPWKKHLNNFISCDVKVARIVESHSKGLEKYKALFGESKDISTIFAVYFSDMLSQSIDILDAYLLELTSRDVA